MSEQTICTVGLGYVGLPLALAFGRTNIPTIGFDVNKQRVKELSEGCDVTEEIPTEEIKSSKVRYSSDPAVIGEANFIIIAVPTPIDDANHPDLTILEKASAMVGKHMKKGSIVVFESTVFPGATEEICGPILEKESGLKRGVDFKLGYSPERINPGDKEHTLERIVKVVSGEDMESAKIVAGTYAVVCAAGVHLAPNIKTAEAAKVIENTQRDINIALMNELSVIFHRLDINTTDVLEAAGTKWNFLKFTPGLVGGHCIGVDPYYLVHKATQVGHHAQVITSGRQVNDFMSEFVADQVIKVLAKQGKVFKNARVLVVGLTFKENVKDVRNSKIAHTIEVLESFSLGVDAYDPMLTKEEIAEEFPNVRLVSNPKAATYDAIILAAPHRSVLEDRETILSLLKPKGMIFDVKGVWRDLATDESVVYDAL